MLVNASAGPSLVCLPVTEVIRRFLAFGVVGDLVFAWLMNPDQSS